MSYSHDINGTPDMENLLSSRDLLARFK